MTVQSEKLYKSLKKAVDGGFHIKEHQFIGRDRQTGEVYGYESIIFDPEFAKALWGDDLINPHGPQIGNLVEEWSNGEKTEVYPYTEDHRARDFLLNPAMFLPTYIYHMKEMAAASDRLGYLDAHT